MSDDYWLDRYEEAFNGLRTWAGVQGALAALLNLYPDDEPLRQLARHADEYAREYGGQLQPNLVQAISRLPNPARRERPAPESLETYARRMGDHE